jgi:uncharacterized protein (TIGR03437 family)
VSTLLGAAPDGVQAASALLNTPNAVVAGNNGDLFVALKGAHQVVRIDSSGMVWVVAGNGALGSGGDGGPAKSATMSAPASLAVDAAGNLYIADSALNRVRVVGTDGAIRPFAGTGQTGSAGDNGPATAALLSSPNAIAFDSSGNLYIADTGNNIVRKVTPDGTISTFAGNRGRGNGGNEGSALHASLNGPAGVTADRSGNVFIADTGNNWIREVTPDGIIHRYAGFDPSTSSGFGGGGDPTLATNATLNTPTSLAVDSAGNLYFVEYGAPRVREVSTVNKISTYAGTGTGGSTGDLGLAVSANLNVLGICMDSSNVLYIADGVSDRVRKVTPADGVIYPVAGVNGIASYTPRGVAVYQSVLYFADNNRIWAYNAANGQVTAIAGTGQAGFSGDTKAANSALLNAPRGIAFDGSGNLYIADTGNNRVREVYASNGTINTIAGTGAASTTGDYGLAVNATLNQPAAVAVDASGSIYVAERSGQVLRQIASISGQLQIATVAGTGIAGPPSSETGIANQQTLNLPQGLMFDAGGGLLIADSGNNRIRRMTKDGTITTVAGSNLSGNSGDGGPATSAALRGPSAVTVDSTGNLYIADTNNNTIRRVDTNGTISTVAGNGTAGYNGDGSPATAYEFSGPTALVPGSGCSLFIADTANLRVRQLWPAFPYTVSSNPPGLQMTIDGQPATSPAVLSLLPGTNHQVGAPSPQAGSAGARYLYSPGTQQISAACGTANQGVTLNFQTQYALTIASDRGGTVGPSAAGWQNSGTGVTLTATAQSGYVFSGWEGDCTGAGTCQLAMTGPKSVKADFAPAAALNPAVKSGGVEGAGLSVPPVNALSPDGLATVFGTGFAPAGTSNSQWLANLVGGNASTEMDGVCVLVGSTRAPITYVSPTQINFQAPQGILPGTVSVTVATACGTPSQVLSAAQTVPVQSASPEFFPFIYNVNGQNPIAAENAVTGVFVGVPGLIPGVTFVPAKPGDLVALYATGLGLTNPPFAAGVLPGSAVWAAGSFQISLGGVPLASSDVLYAGVAPGTPGEYQINIRIPASTPDGNQPVAMTVNGIASPAGAYIAVQH